MSIEIPESIFNTRLMLEDERGVKLPEDPWHLAPTFVAIVANDMRWNNIAHYEDAKAAIHEVFVRMADRELAEYEAYTEETGKIAPQKYSYADYTVHSPFNAYMEPLNSWAFEELKALLLEGTKSWSFGAMLDASCLCACKYSLVHNPVWYKYLRAHNASGASDT